jgi:hypothetical protein
MSAEEFMERSLEGGRLLDTRSSEHYDRGNHAKVCFFIQAFHA